MSPMARIAHTLTAVVVSLAVVAHGADQTILGTLFLVKNPGMPESRKITGKAKELASSDTIVGDPVTSGAMLTISANGGTPSSATYTLPIGASALTGKPFWTGDVLKGFKYKDSKGENGPVKVAQVKKSARGVFQIKTVVSGKLAPVAVVPPNPGTDGCLLFAIVGGDSYSVQFATGQVSNTGPALFKVAKPTAEGTCVPTTTTTTTSSTTTTTLDCLGTGLIVNGCFTLPVVTSPSNGWAFANIDAVGGWFGTGGNPNAEFILNQAGEVGTDPTVGQTVAGLTVGATYRLTGDYRGIFTAAGNPAKPDAFAVRVVPQPSDHASTVVLGLPRPSPDADAWTPFSVDFTPSASEVTITFEAERDGDDSSFAIDNVTLVEVAPPSTSTTTTSTSSSTSTSTTTSTTSTTLACGTFLTKWGSPGSEDGQFDLPLGIAVDGSGNVYVADSSNDRIQQFTSSGTFVTKWGVLGSGDGHFNFPRGVAVDGR